jgi:hypothetical protein
VILGVLVDLLGVVGVDRHLGQRANQVLAHVRDRPPGEPVERRRERVLRALDARQRELFAPGSADAERGPRDLLLVDVAIDSVSPTSSRELSICGS